MTLDDFFRDHARTQEHERDAAAGMSGAADEKQVGMIGGLKGGATKGGEGE
ncbi:MAG: hypothetical protein HC904_15945, partial [Blastochloris sp.]|nr:hypothetical protein [Blastochloris sp.]